jgi:hypothetical protein
MTVPNPFAWDSQYISTSDGADDYVGFEDFENGYGVQQNTNDCPERNFDLWGWAQAKACDKIYNPRGYDDQRTCSQQTNSCDQCLSCCDAIYNAHICKKVSRDIALAELNACRGNCTADLCG